MSIKLHAPNPEKQNKTKVKAKTSKHRKRTLESERTRLFPALRRYNGHALSRTTKPRSHATSLGFRVSGFWYSELRETRVECMFRATSYEPGCSTIRFAVVCSGMLAGGDECCIAVFQLNLISRHIQIQRSLRQVASSERILISQTPGSVQKYCCQSLEP